MIKLASGVKSLKSPVDDIVINRGDFVIYKKSVRQVVKEYVAKNEPTVFPKIRDDLKLKNRILENLLERLVAANEIKYAMLDVQWKGCSRCMRVYYVSDKVGKELAES